MGRGVQTKKAQIRPWFDRGVEALGRAVLNAPRCYGCPLCLRGFPEQRIDALTREHVPPKSLRGQPLILTCNKCNERAGGRNGVDTHARRAEHVLNFALGTMEGSRPIEFGGESLKLRAEAYHGQGGLLVVGLPENNPPQATREACDAMERQVGKSAGCKLSLTLTGDRYSPQRQRVSWLRAAYLAAFAALGYRYILRRELDPVRQQILDPDKKVIDNFKLVDPAAPLGRRLIVFVSEPDWVRGLAVQMGRHTVLLPFYDGDTNFYERLGIAAAESKIEWSGKQQLTWPRQPVFALDFAS